MGAIVPKFCREKTNFFHRDNVVIGQIICFSPQQFNIWVLLFRNYSHETNLAVLRKIYVQTNNDEWMQKLRVLLR